MKDITTRDLRESLTLLLPHLQEDGEGGWIEEWNPSHRLWASIWPLMGAQKEDKPFYRITLRSGILLPPRAAFIWHLHQHTKRLQIINTPVLIQYNRFLSMMAREEKDA